MREKRKKNSKSEKEKKYSFFVDINTSKYKERKSSYIPHKWVYLCTKMLKNNTQKCTQKDISSLERKIIFVHKGEIINKKREKFFWVYLNVFVSYGVGVSSLSQRTLVIFS